MAHSHHDEPKPAVVRPAVYLPTGLIIALIVLRLATGWHFYREGTKKLAYNPDTGQTTLAFSSEPMLRMAVGPAAKMIKETLPNVYDWEKHLAIPRQARPSTEDELTARAKWEADYASRRKAALAKKEPVPIEFPPHSPYYDWADRIEDGWRNSHDQFVLIPGLSNEQRQAAAASLDFRHQQLADYLESQTDAIAEWEHELYRLDQMQRDVSSVSLPFMGTRISEKAAETKAASGAWIAQVRSIEDAYKGDLREILTVEQAEDPATSQLVDEALVDEDARKLHQLNVAVTALIIGTGVCLLLGLFTRVAAVAGIGFLLSVIATQPPWVAGANNPVFYYQVVEIAAFVVIFASSAGRYAGLDYFISRITGKCCSRKESV